MKRTLSLVFALGIAMGLALSVTPAHAGPGTEFSLFLLLNGERSRTLQADGGGLALWTTDAGMATATVPANGVVYLENAGTAIAYVCGPLADGTWDGGCSTTTSDPNYGSPIAVGGYRWISLRGTTSTLKAVPASGSAAINVPVFIMR